MIYTKETLYEELKETFINVLKNKVVNKLNFFMEKTDDSIMIRLKYDGNTRTIGVFTDNTIICDNSIEYELIKYIIDKIEYIRIVINKPYKFVWYKINTPLFPISNIYTELFNKLNYFEDITLNVYNDNGLNIMITKKYKNTENICMIRINDTITTHNCPLDLLFFVIKNKDLFKSKGITTLTCKRDEIGNLNTTYINKYYLSKTNNKDDYYKLIKEDLDEIKD